MINKLYTIGYQGLRGVYSLLHLTVPLDATIIDIRYVPWSWDERWREEGLLKRLCDLSFGGLSCRYVHMKELGNINYKVEGAAIELMHAEFGIARLHEQLKRKPCLLLCQCRDVESCHRKVVAELAARWIEGLEVEHLAVSPGGQAIRSVDLAGLETGAALVPVVAPAGKVATVASKSQDQGQMAMF
jgi:hypothetical protein